MSFFCNRIQNKESNARTHTIQVSINLYDLKSASDSLLTMYMVCKKDKHSHSKQPKTTEALKGQRTYFTIDS